MYFPMNDLIQFVHLRPHPISHSEINQSLYDLPSSGLIVFEVLVVCLVNRSRVVICGLRCRGRVVCDIFDQRCNSRGSLACPLACPLESRPAGNALILCVFIRGYHY